VHKKMRGDLVVDPKGPRIKGRGGGLKEGKQRNVMLKAAITDCTGLWDEGGKYRGKGRDRQEGKRGGEGGERFQRF